MTTQPKDSPIGYAYLSKRYQGHSLAVVEALDSLEFALDGGHDDACECKKIEKAAARALVILSASAARLAASLLNEGD